MLRLDNLSKSYDNHPVFQGLTYLFEPGCYALCEENSTGKSTLLALIAGTLAPDSGDVWIDGYSLAQTPQQAKARLAYVPDNCQQFPMMTGRELLEQTAAEKNAAIDESVLDVARCLELTEHLDKRFEQMSTGMRRKVYLTAAALGRPAVIVADGPTNGLDAGSCRALAQQFKRWGQDRVVLFASYDTDWVQSCGASILEVGALR